jgi:hypothetical protein
LTFHAESRGPESSSAGEGVLKRFGLGLVCGLGGYLVIAIVSYFAVLQFSPNRHDRELEAAMTSVFFWDVYPDIFGMARPSKKQYNDSLLELIK